MAHNQTTTLAITSPRWPMRLPAIFPAADHYAMVFPMIRRIACACLVFFTFGACSGPGRSHADDARNSLNNAYFVQQQVFLAYQAEGVPMPKELEATSATVRAWWQTMEFAGPDLATALDLVGPGKPRRIVYGQDGVALAYSEAMKAQGNPSEKLIRELVRLAAASETNNP